METAQQQKYRCLSCNETFTVKPGKKPRCPLCMSIHSVEPVSEKSGAGGATSRLPAWLGWKQGVGAAAVLGLAVGGYFLYKAFVPSTAPITEDPAKLGALKSEKLQEFLTSQNIEPGNVIDPFDAGTDLESFAKEHVSIGSSSHRAQSLYKAFLDLKGEGKFAAYVPRQPRKTPFMNAGEAFAAVSGKSANKGSAEASGGASSGASPGGKPRLYSLELAVMLVSAARIAGLPAVVAEVPGYPDTKAPLDPSGNYGHFACAVYSGGSYEGDFTIFDLHQGRTMPGAQAGALPLRDAVVVANVLGHDASRLLAVEFDAREALVKLEDALMLAPESVQLVTLRALIFVSSGGIDEGKDELRKAMSLRTDAQRLVKWGAILLAEDEGEEAMAELHKAIDLAPDYALAHASLAMALLSEGERREAEASLARAAELDPEDPLVPVYQANYWMSVGKLDKALESAQLAYEQNYHEPQVGLMLAAIYKELGRDDKVRQILQQIRQNEDLPGELLALIDSQLGAMSASPSSGVGDDDDDFDDDDDDDDLDDDEPIGGSAGSGLQKPTFGSRPSTGLLTGGGGLSLQPGSGTSLQKPGGLLGGGN